MFWIENCEKNAYLTASEMSVEDVKNCIEEVNPDDTTSILLKCQCRKAR